jgi:Na+/H+ antiporter NhaD/arsenite permease-like protein
MSAIVILIFVLGYLAIVFEHQLKIDKTVSALLLGGLAWAILALGYNSGQLSIIDSHQHLFNSQSGQPDVVADAFTQTLLHHTGVIAEILIFLIGAMTIVELIDIHKGFDVLKGMVNTKSKQNLLWITGIIGFFLSSIIDNLTATIVLITLLRKLVPSKEERMFYASLIVISTNAGGAWSPIGDVTTTMLWIGKKVSAGGLMLSVALPSVMCLIVPYFLASRDKMFKGEIDADAYVENETPLRSSNLMLWVGLGAIVFVPIFKTIFHLPPYLGMMIALAIVWMVSDFYNPEENMTPDIKKNYSVQKALSKIDLSSVLFFLGILLGVASLETMATNGVGTLMAAAKGLESAIPNKDIVVILLGVFSAVIDNVPLVAASMGMFSEPIDAKLWHFLAFTAGTGGSMLIIGSAAGVAAMGMEKIPFMWFFKKVTWLAAAGYIAGVVTYLIQYSFLQS